MINNKIFLIIVSCVLFTGCISINYSLLNENDDFRDFENKTDKGKYYIVFGIEDIKKDIFQYSKDSLCPRLKYSFTIATPKLPNINLNSFTFTLLENKDTIPFVLYYESLYTSPKIIDSIPFRLLNGDSDSLRYFTIVAESCEAFNRIKEVYISYDIEIGEDRIIMNNIHYKRKLEIEYRPKIW